VTAIRSVVALTSGSAPCARCEAFHAVTGGQWHAVEPHLPHLPVCDSCAQWDDPDGFAAMQERLGTEAT
jgi:hypothetical protein